MARGTAVDPDKMARARRLYREGLTVRRASAKAGVGAGTLSQHLTAHDRTAHYAVLAAQDEDEDGVGDDAGREETPSPQPSRRRAVAAAEDDDAPPSLPEPAPEAGGPSLPEPVACEYRPFLLDTPGAVGILSDSHIPFHDLPTIRAWVDDCKRMAVKAILLNGDILDFYQLSDYVRDPSMPRLREEIIKGRQFLQYLRSTFPRARIVYKEGNHECFDEATEVLTDRGWLKHDQLTPDTKVASYRQADGVIEFSVPLALHRSEFSGELVRIVCEGADLAVTPNHRILYRPVGTRGRDAKWRITPLSEMPLGKNRVILPVAGSSGMPEYPLSDDEIRIAAWILTDGGISRVGRKSPSVTFYQRTEKAHLITEILNRLGWEYSYRVRERNITAICGKTLKNPPKPSAEMRLRKPAAEKALALASTKERLPGWVVRLSDRQFRVFLSSFVDGDGSRHRSNPETAWMAYGKKPILDDVQACAVTHGWRASLSEYRPGDWRVNLTPNRTLALDRFGELVRKEAYSGTVWCVTTANDTVVVRRNGKVAVTGNSRLSRYLATKAPDLFDLPEVSLPGLLEADRHGVEFVLDKRLVMVGKLPVIHGHEYRGGGGVMPARWLYLRTGESALMGHLHQPTFYSFRTITGREVGMWSVGCSCFLAASYGPLNQWGHGWCITEVAQDGHFHVHNRRRLRDGQIV